MEQKMELEDEEESLHKAAQLIRVAYIFTTLIQCTSMYIFHKGAKKEFSDPIYMLWKVYTCADIICATSFVLGIEHLLQIPTVIPGRLVEFLLLSSWYTSLCMQLLLAVYRYIVITKPIFYFNWRLSKEWLRSWFFASVGSGVLGIMLGAPIVVPGVSMYYGWYSKTYTNIFFLILFASASVYFTMWITRMCSKCWPDVNPENFPMPPMSFSQAKSERNMLIASAVSCFFSLLPFIVYIPHPATYHVVSTILGCFALINTPIIHFTISSSYRKVVFDVFRCRIMKSVNASSVEMIRVIPRAGPESADPGISSIYPGNTGAT